MPIDELLVSALPGDRRVAARELGTLVRLAMDGGAPGPRVGDLHQGRIVRLAPSLDGAFVDIGSERPGVLMRADAPAGRPLAEGQTVLVRISREGEGEKGVKLDGRLAAEDHARSEALAGARSTPGRLAEGADPVLTLLRGAAGPSLRRVVVDDAATLVDLRASVPAIAPRLQLWQEREALFVAEGVDEQIAEALAPTVPLASGGRVTIEHAAAVTAIDVDVGAAAGSGGSAKTAALNCDLEAAKAIGRHIVLRDIGGLVVVDFVPIRRPGDRARVLAALRAALVDDDRAVRIGGWTRLGLLELTRQRLGPPLAVRLSGRCATCAGEGRTAAPWWVAGEALRAVLAASRHAPGAAPRLLASPPLLACLQKTMAVTRAAVEAKLGCPLELIEVAGGPAAEYRLDFAARPRTGF